MINGILSHMNPNSPDGGRDGNKDPIRPSAGGTPQERWAARTVREARPSLRFTHAVTPDLLNKASYLSIYLSPSSLSLDLARVNGCSDHSLTLLE